MWVPGCVRMKYKDAAIEFNSMRQCQQNILQMCQLVYGAGWAPASLAFEPNGSAITVNTACKNWSAVCKYFCKCLYPSLTAAQHTWFWAMQKTEIRHWVLSVKWIRMTWFPVASLVVDFWSESWLVNPNSNWVMNPNSNSQSLHCKFTRFTTKSWHPQ